MTPRQVSYIQHRAAGRGQASAAIAAGYAKSSAKVIASRMEKLPAIRDAINEALNEAQTVLGAPQEFHGAEDYLLAVVQGTVPPDPVRVGAARALLPYLKARQRAPLKGETPKQLDAHNKLAGEQELLDQWAAKAAQVRARLRK